jgi:hypothetical protein
MGKLKRAFILLSVVGLAFGYSLAGFTATPSKVEAAEVNGDRIVPSETIEAAAVSNKVQDSDPACEEPSAANAHVYDGGVAGIEKSYFNTIDQISGNWSGFETTLECPIIKYKYSIRKVSLPKETIIDWRVPANPTDTNIIEASLSLEEGAKYVIWVKARNQGGWSKAVRSSGQTLDLTAPVINYLGLQQNRPYGGGIVLNWVPANDAYGIDQYQIYRNDTLLTTVNGGVNSFADTISGDNINFSYFIKAVDQAGNISDPSNIQSVLVDDVAPSAPIISSFVGGGKIAIAWGAVVGATSYELYRDGALVKSGLETEYTDTNIIKGNTYSYAAFAFDEAGNKSNPSNTLQIFVPKPTVSSVATTAAAGQVQGETTAPGEQQISPSPSPSPSGEVKASESTQPSETAETKKTNWSLIIAIIIAAAIVVAGVLYWWYAREEEDEI